MTASTVEHFQVEHPMSLFVFLVEMTIDAISKITAQNKQFIMS